MTPFEIGMVFMQVGLQMRALADWMMCNHGKISPATELFIARYMTQLSRYGSVTMAALDNPQSAPGRCIFF